MEYEVNWGTDPERTIGRFLRLTVSDSSNVFVSTNQPSYRSLQAGHSVANLALIRDHTAEALGTSDQHRYR